MTTREMVADEPEERKREDGSASAGAESSLERPRNHSLPNMTWTEDKDLGEDSLNDSIDSLSDPVTMGPDTKEKPKKEPGSGSWEYVLTRDFRNEVVTYIDLKKKRDAEKKSKAVAKKEKVEEKKLEKDMHERGPLAREDINLKICDLGNGCWTHHHFT